MDNWLYWPPVAFAVVFLFAALYLRLLGVFAFRSTSGPGAGGKTKSYACGEDIEYHRIQPDYSQFFPFAFLFTVMHVVVMMVATVPHGHTGIAVIDLLYVLAAVVGVSIVLRRE